MIETSYTLEQFEARYPGFGQLAPSVLRDLEKSGLVELRGHFDFDVVAVLDEERLNALHAAELLRKQGGGDDRSRMQDFIKQSISKRLNKFLGSKSTSNMRKQMQADVQAHLDDLRNQGTIDGWEVNDETTSEQAARGELGMKVKFKQGINMQTIQFTIGDPVSK